jgi:hypothetical protein
MQVKNLWGEYVTVQAIPNVSKKHIRSPAIKTNNSVRMNQINYIANKAGDSQEQRYQIKNYYLNKNKGS